MLLDDAYAIQALLVSWTLVEEAEVLVKWERYGPEKRA